MSHKVHIVMTRYSYYSSSGKTEEQEEQMPPVQWPDIGQELPEGMQVKRSGDFSEQRNHCVSLQR